MPSAPPPYSRDVDGVGPWHPGLRPQVGLTWPVGPGRQRPVPDMRPVWQRCERRSPMSQTSSSFGRCCERIPAGLGAPSATRTRAAAKEALSALVALPTPSLACEHIVTM